jgi:hypothetical protein
VRVLGEEPGLGLPNQHTKACPRFQATHCHCPPATGPNQPHEPGCSHFKTTAESWGSHTDFDFSAMQMIAYDHALRWLARQDTTPRSFVASLGRTTGTVDMDGVEIAVADLVGVTGVDVGGKDETLVTVYSGCTCGAFEDADIDHAASCPLALIECDEVSLVRNLGKP